MASPASRSCCLLLIGKAGNGKSSTGNTILGDECFDTSNTGRSREPKVNSGRFGNWNVTVVDGQGFESKKPNELNWTKRIIAEINSAVVLCGDGFDVLALVLKYGNRFTREEQDVIQILRQVLGPNVFRNHCILIFTNGEDFTLYSRRKEDLTFEEWSDNQTGELGDLIKECDNRVVLFHNLTEMMREKSVERLLSLVEKTGERYTSAMFEGMKESHEKLVYRESVNQEEQRLQQKIDNINRKLNTVKETTKSPQQLKKELEVLREETAYVMKEIEEKDGGTGCLRFLKTSVQSVILDTDSLLSSYHREENRDSVDLRPSNENNRCWLKRFLHNLLRPRFWWMPHVVMIAISCFYLIYVYHVKTVV